MRLAPPGRGWINWRTRWHHRGRRVAWRSTPRARWWLRPPDVVGVVIVVVVVDLLSRRRRRHLDDVVVVVDVDGGPAEVDGGLRRHDADRRRHGRRVKVAANPVIVFLRFHCKDQKWFRHSSESEYQASVG